MSGRSLGRNSKQSNESAKINTLNDKVIGEKKQGEPAAKEDGRPPTATSASKPNERNSKDSKHVVDVVKSSVSLVQG